MLCRGLTALVLLSAYAFGGGEFWNDKPPSEWTDSDVRELRTHSPWAKEASVQFSSVRGTFAGSGTSIPGGTGGRSRRGSGSGAAAASAGPASLPAIGVTLRWESAAPLRDSASRVGTDASPLAEWAKEFYVVTATGFPSMGSGSGAGGRPDDPGELQQIGERLKGSTFLKRKGKEPIALERVEMLKGPEGANLAFLFSRRALITPHDGEVTFESKISPMEVKCSFKLKDMVYKGSLQL